MSTQALIGTVGLMDTMMVASLSALLVMMILCASDVIKLATVANHLKTDGNTGRIWIKVAHEHIELALI